MKPLKTRERKHLCRINKLHSPTLRQPWRLKCLISVIYTIKALHCGNYLARSSIYAHVYSISCSLGCFFNRLGCTQIREWKRSGSKQGISKEEIFLGVFFFPPCGGVYIICQPNYKTRTFLLTPVFIQPCRNSPCEKCSVCSVEQLDHKILFYF